MSESVEPLLSQNEVAKMVRLLGEVAGMTAPLETRRSALMEKLLELVNADTWLWAHARIDPQVQDPVWFTLLEGGWRDDAERAIAMESINHPAIVSELFRKIDKTRHVSFSRQQQSPPEKWDGDGYRRQFSQSTNIRDTVLSFYPVSDRVISSIGINRRSDKANFTESEVAMIHLILGQIPWLHSAPADVPANNDDLLDIPRRQREVLMHLLVGATVKEVAARLGISAHTVGDYTKLLYRRFQVSSRAELIRKFMSGAAVKQAVGDEPPGLIDQQ